MSDRHLSELALERHLAQPSRPDDAHLAGCARCQARLAELAREGDEFRRFVYPRTLDAVLEKQGARRSRPRWWLLAFVPAMAAAAALLVVVRPGAPADDYVGTKGAALGLAVFAGGAAGARALDDGASVPASAALRFRVHPSAACHLWIVSADAAGEVSRLFPAEGEGGALVSGVSPLPGGAVLDGRAGPERFFAVCARSALPFAALEKSVRAAAGRGAAAVRGARALAGLPEETTQATLLVEKTP